MEINDFLPLFVVATAVAIGARWLKLPYTIALVLAGLGLGAAGLFRPPHLTQDLLFELLLPPLIFEAAFHLESHLFWEDRVIIVGMAIPGVLVATLLTAAMLVPAVNFGKAAVGFTFLDGLLFAALISATDPIAVVGLFKSLGAPHRLASLVEGESLLNDGTGVVVFTLALQVVQGVPMTLPGAALEFVRVAGLGGLLGAAIGWGISHIIKRIDDPMIELTLTVICAWGSFGLADRLHVSGVIATVAAGMYCGNYAARVGMQPTTQAAVEVFWEYIAFALNSVVFLLIGFELKIGQLLEAWLPIVLAYVAMTAARALVVFVVSLLVLPTAAKLPWRWAFIISWSGLRGALSMVLVLGLPDTMPQKSLLVTMTFGVVLLSILVQGLTMGPLLRLFRIIVPEAPKEPHVAANAA
jgi:CPA1 family monovalent cation:H+ antiporter